MMNTTLIFWLICAAVGLASVSWWSWVLWSTSSDKTVLLPGPSMHGHYQIEMQCAACHDPEGGVDEQRCLDCHQAELEAAEDSHPEKKFRDPRNADRLEKINARSCITCHVEHQPERTLPMGLTQPGDYCFHCHSDIAEHRPSHEGLDFTTCATAGCHNYHDNRALYEDFLVKHGHGEAIAETPHLPMRDFTNRWRKQHGEPKNLAAIGLDVTEQLYANAIVTQEWHDSVHHLAGVSCADCHQQDDQAWVEKPTHKHCQQCHEGEVKGWLGGKHGMRVAQGLTPMTPGQARLPMHNEVAHEQLSCVSCHASHSFDTRVAAVESCLRCHADEHSLAYKNSPHYAAWQAELAGTAPAGSGVSCATCHLPRREHEKHGKKWVTVEHNQNAFLRPNETMIRESCLHCHGLGFSLDALSDPGLIKGNFHRPPAKHVESIDWALKRE